LKLGKTGQIQWSLIKLVVFAEVTNPAHGSGRMIQVLSIQNVFGEGLNPANGSWRIVQVLFLSRTQQSANSSRPVFNPAHGSGRMIQVLSIQTIWRGFESRQRKLADCSGPNYSSTTPVHHK
jgi:hypothetical protein